MPRLFHASSLVCACVLLFGCASQNLPGKRDPRDPFERMNRVTYRFNDRLDKAIARPIARTYVKITPRFLQTGVSNFVDNLTYPTTIVNDLLQGKIVQTCADTGRLVLNSTVGIGGLLDPASAVGLDKNDEDFGQTLGRWGVKTGPYLVLPLFGFSDFRDGFGRVADIFTTPTYYIDNSTIGWTIWGVEFLDTRARLLNTEKLLQGVYDPYAFTRNAYLARREYLVTDGEAVEEPPGEDEDFDQPSGGPEGGATQPQSPGTPPPPGAPRSPPKPPQPQPKP